MIRAYIPDAAISTDIITGFCGETIDDHKDTLSMMDYVGYDYAFMFNYSQRPNTIAEKKFVDDIPQEEKSRRLDEIIVKQRELSFLSNKRDLGMEYEVLVEGRSKKNKEELFGRTSQNKVVIFSKEDLKLGQYIRVRIKDCTSGTLIGERIS